MPSRRGLFGWVAAALAMPVAFAAKATSRRDQEDATHIDRLTRAEADSFINPPADPHPFEGLTHSPPPWNAPPGGRYIGTYRNIPMYRVDSLEPFVSGRN